MAKIRTKLNRCRACRPLFWPIFSRGQRSLTPTYYDVLPWIAKIQPRWLIYLNTNKVLEQDLPLIVGQTLEIEQSKQSLKEIYLSLKTSDVLVVEYRKWLDNHGSLLPFCQGYEISHNIEPKSIEEVELCRMARRG